jgi:hypothetical protein
LNAMVAENSVKGRISLRKKNSEFSWIHFRVASWIVFKPKIPIWVKFGGAQIGKCWYIRYMAIWNILQTFGIFYDHLVQFVFSWYIFSFFLVSCTKKNLATLIHFLVINWGLYVVGERSALA